MDKNIIRDIWKFDAGEVRRLQTTSMISLYICMKQRWRQNPSLSYKGLFPIQTQGFFKMYIHDVFNLKCLANMTTQYIKA